MLTVRLHGHLEEKFGSEFKFEAATVREVIDALQSNFDDFTEEFIKDQRAYNIIIDAEAQELLGCLVPIKTDSTVDIVPVIGGAGIFKALGFIIVAVLLLFPPTAAAIGGFLAGGAGAGTMGSAFASVLAGGSASAVIAGGGLAAVGAALAVGVQALAWGLLLAGVASLLAGPDGPDGATAGTSLSNTDNLVGQGSGVPIGYGRLMVGSVVLSASYTSSYYQAISKAWSYENLQTGEHLDHVTNPGSVVNDAPLTATDGLPIITIGSTFITGFTKEQLALLNDAAQAALGNGTYDVQTVTTKSGVTTPTAIFVPPGYNGKYNDSLINPRYT